MTMVNDVTNALVVAGVGQITDPAADWFIWGGRFQDADPSSAPAIADRAIAIFEAPGNPPDPTWALDYPDFQVRVRSEPDGYDAATRKMHEAFLALHDGEVALNAGVSPPSAVFVYCYAKTSGPIPLGFDEKRRAQLGMNFRTMRDRAT